jgi:hypothetical protein
MSMKESSSRLNAEAAHSKRGAASVAPRAPKRNDGGRIFPWKTSGNSISTAGRNIRDSPVSNEDEFAVQRRVVIFGRIPTINPMSAI